MFVVEQRCDIEHSHAVEQDGDMSTCNGDDAARFEFLVDVFVLFDDGESMLKLPFIFEALVDFVDASEVMGIEFAEDANGIFALGCEMVGVVFAFHETPYRGECVVESQSVELLECTKFVLATSVSMEEFLVEFVNSLTTTVYPEIADVRVLVENAFEFVVFAFSLLPTCIDAGDTTGESEFIDGLCHGHVHSLRTEYNDFSVGVGIHQAAPDWKRRVSVRSL
jgi:hypothetical protein